MRRSVVAVVALGGALAGRNIEVEIEVDGRMRRLVAGPEDDPLAVAEEFCSAHNLSDSIEGLPCGSTLTEELIVLGARHALPWEPALKLREGRVREAIQTFSGGIDEDGLAALAASVAELIPEDGLGPGLLYVPVRNYPRAPRVEPPTARVVLFDNRTAMAWTSMLEDTIVEFEGILTQQKKKCQFGRAAAAFCVAHRCSNRVAAAAEVARRLGPCDHARRRVVVSLSTLPGRLRQLPRQLGFILGQTAPADAVYVAVPTAKSTRERRPYVVPLELEAMAAKGDVTLLRTRVDWGPATKLIPVLLVETAPETIVVTVDDDIDYPSTLLAELLAGVDRHPNAAVGLRGYRLPAATTHETSLAHENMRYFDSAELATDARVDVLGGMAGVAYRSGFFDARRLADYRSWPGGAFFVDDDWISAALDDAKVPRFVLKGGGAARALREDPVVAPHHDVAALNAPDHAFRNIKFQEQLLTAAVANGLFETQPCRFRHAAAAGAFFQPIFDRLEADVCSSSSGGALPRVGDDDRSAFLFVQTRASATSNVTQILDAFLSHHGGELKAVCSSPEEAATLQSELSRATALGGSSASRFLWNFYSQHLDKAQPVDLLHLGGGPSSSSGGLLLEEFAAALGSGVFERGHTILTFEEEEDVGGLLRSFLQELGCFEMAHQVCPPDTSAVPCASSSAWVCH